jgi:hypothetical protein
MTLSLRDDRCRMNKCRRKATLVLKVAGRWLRVCVLCYREQRAIEKAGAA